ncbi:hypothetical protein A6R68_00908, partial [Neotoma lepida]
MSGFASLTVKKMTQVTTAKYRHLGKDFHTIKHVCEENTTISRKKLCNKLASCHPSDEVDPERSCGRPLYPVAGGEKEGIIMFLRSPLDQITEVVPLRLWESLQPAALAVWTLGDIIESKAIITPSGRVLPNQVFSTAPGFQSNSCASSPPVSKESSGTFQQKERTVINTVLNHLGRKSSTQ